MAGLVADTGTMTFSFSNAQSAVGGFINYAPDFGSATLAVYDSGHNLIETATLSFNTHNTTNSGEFLGFQETTADISYFTLSNAFVGIMDLTTLQSSATPEPASLFTLGLGVAGMACYAWKRRKTLVSA
jgi:hypothetical protein